jgi:hypothetical protein
MPARPLLLTLAVLTLAGCGGNDDAGPVTSTMTAEGTTTGAGTTPLAPTGLAGASTDPVTHTSDIGGVALLTGVRAASHEGYDRVVLELRGGVPGYDVRYVERPVRADGSGEPVVVDGGAVLLVRMEPALDADLTQESAARTYTGPTRLTPSTTAVVELVRTGGFESVLTWAVGVDEKRPFRVTRLESPSRIVIDVASS